MLVVKCRKYGHRVTECEKGKKDKKEKTKMKQDGTNPGSKDHGPVQHLVHLSHADKGPDPSATAPLAQPDKTNSSHGSPTLEPVKNFSNPTAEGKWLRIQRPIHSSDITPSEAVLGKRSPLSHLKSPIPLKRRAVEGAVQESNEPFPPPAEAVAQPRRGR